jgi:hypothetical protein
MFRLAQYTDSYHLAGICCLLCAVATAISILPFPAELGNNLYGNFTENNTISSRFYTV